MKATKATSAPKGRADESEPANAVRRRMRRRKPTSEPQNASQKVPGLSYPVMNGEDLFEALSRLRREAEIEIDRLIAFLDKTDSYASTELEAEDDGDELERWEGDDNCDDEPSLVSAEGHIRFPMVGGVVDGEEGDLSVAELDRLRERRRQRRGNVRPLTAEEHARLFGGLKSNGRLAEDGPAAAS